MAMAEREQGHRHYSESLESTQSFQLARRGQIFALLALSIMAALAITLAVVGEPVWATIAGGVDVAAVVGVFITGQRRSVEEQSEPEEPAQDRNARPAVEGNNTDEEP
ncbi:hypothetical protein AB0935_26995 [Streptomyces sp. NPDC007027]|uniref:hypothetical protein n=1 Tax=Streptomyces sp. NPDC007027 TaxID=3157086 RepID=UPI003455F019